MEYGCEGGGGEGNVEKWKQCKPVVWVKIGSQLLWAFRVLLPHNIKVPKLE